VSDSPVIAMHPCAPGIDLSSFEIPHPRPFACRLHVEHGLTSNVVGHVSNIDYVRWIDRLAELHADHVGYTRSAMLADGVMWFVGRHEIDYRAESFPGETLLLLTWVRSFSRVKSWRESVIVRPADLQVICRSLTLWVLVDLATRKPTRIPAEMAARFDPLVAAGGTPRAEVHSGRK